MLIGIDGNEANNVRPDIKARVGVNQYAYGLIKALHQLDHKNQYQVFLEAEPQADLPSKRKGWDYRVVGRAKFWTQWRLPLELYLGRPRPEVFFTPSHYGPRFSPVPRVISIMDLGFYRFPEQFKKRDLWQLKNWTEQSVKKAARILAISEATKNDIIKHYRIEPEKITVTYPGYDKDKFKVKSLPRGEAIRGEKLKVERVKRKYKIKSDYILYLGTLKPSKNIEGLIEAYKILITNHQPARRSPASPGEGGSPITLVIAGKKGWMFETIFERVKRLKLEKEVVFTDFVAQDDVPPLMTGAQVFVLPSFWEGFGIPVVEAMAVGTPVVVSNVASLPEVVGDAGIKVDAGDPRDIATGITKAIENKEKLSQRGIRQAQKFDWQSCARKTLSVLQEAAE